MISFHDWSLLLSFKSCEGGSRGGRGWAMLRVSIDIHRPAQERARNVCPHSNWFAMGQTQKRRSQGRQWGTPRRGGLGPLDRAGKYNVCYFNTEKIAFNNALRSYAHGTLVFFFLCPWGIIWSCTCERLCVHFHAALRGITKCPKPVIWEQSIRV